MMVGVAGFEPATSWSRTKRSTKLSHTPKNIAIGSPMALVGEEGFEPSQTESESVVLPLHNSPVLHYYTLLKKFVKKI